MKLIKKSSPALALCALIVLLLAACTSTTSGKVAQSAPAGSATSGTTPSPGATSASTTASTAPPSTTPAPTPTGTPVHIALKFSDGSTFGVGIPVIAYFSQHLTDATALQTATTVTVNGTPAQGAWYFEPVSGHPGYPIEGDFRLQNYWPAHSQILVNIPVKGLSAGTGMVFDDSLTSSFSTGASHVLTVNGATHRLTVVTDGVTGASYPVSLGATDTPTLLGTKVIMEKGLDIPMSGPGYYDPHVEDTQRLTYGGEYLHSAPWNVYNITHGIDSSNGCTNLLPADAVTLFKLLNIGDVVTYTNIQEATTRMSLGTGYGDWNLPWSAWLTGGDVQKI